MSCHPWGEGTNKKKGALSHGGGWRKEEPDTQKATSLGKNRATGT